MPDETSPGELYRRRLNLLRAASWAVSKCSKEASASGHYAAAEADVLQIHAFCMAGLLDAAGRYRDGPLAQIGHHKPPSADKIARHMQHFIAHINAMWRASSPMQIGAYALWRLNWIHPFWNGNGRTSRIFAYMLICMKAGGALRGKKLVPELLEERRPLYVKALRAGDRQNLRPMEDLLAHILYLQIFGK